MSEKERGAASSRNRWGAMLAVYAVAAVTGHLLGTTRFAPGSAGASVSRSSAAARVGFVLEQQDPELTGEAWRALSRDVSAVRAGWKAHDRQVLDLVIALRGLETSGKPQWAEAEQTCQALRWPRCDRAALEQLKRRSRP